MKKCSRRISFLRREITLDVILIVHSNCQSQGASLESIKHLATSIPEQLPGFHGIFLFHCFVLSFFLGFRIPFNPWTKRGATTRVTP